MHDYQRYLEDYEDKHRLECKPYLQVFVNLASSSNTRFDELGQLHDDWKHQIYRNKSKEYRYKCRCECRKWIEYVEERLRRCG